MRKTFTISEIETELRKRLRYDYIWGRKQGNFYDRKTKFIYDTFYFDDLIQRIDNEFKDAEDYTGVLNYALNRWYNFWSAEAVVKIMCEHPNVKPALNQYDRLVDLTIDDIPFDHKTSVFPKGYHGDVNAARENPADLIKWLYTQQSQEQRLHLKNRLFLVLHAPDGKHWKLKAEIHWIKDIIDTYLDGFDKDRLIKLSFDPHSITLSDIIWGVKEA